MHPSLTNLGLFKGMNLVEISRLLNSCRHNVKTYAKGERIALKGSRYHGLIILSQGSVASENADRSGIVTKKEVLQAPVLIAPAHLFAEDNRIPADITARTAVQAIIIPREEFCSMLQKEVRVLKNFLEIFSTPGGLIPDSAAYLAYKTIKGKFANYLLDRMRQHGSTRFRNDLTQREMAGLFGVTRPALAHAMGELTAEGTISVKGKEISILYVEKLRQYAKN